MAEEGRGQRHSAPKVAPVTGQPFKSFDNASRRTKRQKGHCMELQGGALFWFSPKFTRQKFSNRENFFQLAPFLPTKFFHFSSEKIGKRSAPCTLESVPSRSVDTDRWVRRQRFFEPQKISAAGRGVIVAYIGPYPNGTPHWITSQWYIYLNWCCLIPFLYY